MAGSGCDLLYATTWAEGPVHAVSGYSSGVIFSDAYNRNWQIEKSDEFGNAWQPRLHMSELILVAVRSHRPHQD
jgi:hypothetical protein